MQPVAFQLTAKTVAGIFAPVGDDPDVKVVAHPVGLGTTGDDRVEGFIEHISEESGLALSAFQSLTHRRGLVHHHHDGRR